MKCYGCNEVLTENNNSAAHIIPNALGGRLSPKNIICKTCNGNLDRLADNKLVKAFGPWPTLLQIPRQRFNLPSFNLETDCGNEVRLNADASLTKLEVNYSVSGTEEERHVDISAASEKTMLQLVQRAKQEFSQLNDYTDDELRQHFKIGNMPDNERIKIKIDLHPKEVFGGCATSFWLFIIHKSNHSLMNWEQLLEYIRCCQNGKNLRYYTQGLPGLNGPDMKLGHKLILRSVPKKGQLIAYVEILNILKVGCVFAESPNPGPFIEHIYAYDLSMKKDRSVEFSIDSEVFDEQEWSEFGLTPRDSGLIKNYILEQLEKLNGYYQNMNAT